MVAFVSFHCKAMGLAAAPYRVPSVTGKLVLPVPVGGHPVSVQSWACLIVTAASGELVLPALVTLQESPH